MKVENAATMLFLPAPYTADHARRFDSEQLLAVKKSPDAFAFLAGGGSLNGMIQEAVRTGRTDAEVQRIFKERAEAIVRQGALGFGEMTAEHFAGATPYQYAPPDHPLFLLLADLAAQHGLVIDLHLEAVPHPMTLPPDMKSPPNPPSLHENIAAFERLLSHNRGARIIWAHAGSDNTGYRTPELCRRLLGTHPNLFMQIKVDPANHGRNYPIADDGRIKPDWLELLQDFPDRFVVGSDQHYPLPAAGLQRWQSAVLLLNELPETLRRKIGFENAVRLYHLTSFPRRLNEFAILVQARHRTWQVEW
jgi:predicted TIM-barrel fold metal-dependent hydrolase